MRASRWLFASTSTCSSEYCPGFPGTQREITKVYTVRIPWNQKSGTYYLGVVLDYSKQLPESNESNNAGKVVFADANKSACLLKASARIKRRLLFAIGGRLSDWAIRYTQPQKRAVFTTLFAFTSTLLKSPAKFRSLFNITTLPL